MTKRLSIIVIAAVLCSLLTGVGFAGWAITQVDPSAKLSMGVGSDEIFFSSEYIALSDEPQCFDYTYRGFRTKGEAEDGTEDKIGYKGTITARYIINLDNCRALYIGATSVTVELTLGFLNSPATNNMFSEEGFITAEVKASSEELIKLDEDYQKAEDNIFYVDLELDLRNQEKTLTLDVTYDFDLKNFDNYSKYVYDQLTVEGQQLSFNAKIFERA